MKLPPYPKTKPSGVDWLGDVPEHWEVKRLSYLATLKSGENITSEMIAEGGDYPVYGGNGFRGNYHQFTHRGHYALIGRQGALCGNINYASGEFWASEHALVVSPLKEFAVIWMGELLRAMNLGQYSVTAAQPGIAAEMIGGLRIPVPPLPEQRAIALFLDRETGRVDRLVAKKRELIERLKEKRTALISRTVTRGLPPAAAKASGFPANPHMKNSGIEWIGEIPGHWSAKKLGYGAWLQGGYAFASDKFDSEGVPVVRMNNLKRGALDTFQASCVAPENCVETVALAEGDLLWGMSGSIGETGSLGNFARVRQSDLPAQLNQRVGRFRVIGEQVSLDYLTFVIQTKFFYDQILLFVTGTAQFNVSSAQVQSVFLPFPPLPEQAAIAAYLDEETAKLDALVGKVAEAVERLQEYRTALITAAVTGKIDVRKETK